MALLSAGGPLVCGTTASGAVAPATNLPPDYSVVDPSRNWYYFYAFPDGGQRETIQASSADLLGAFQRRWNAWVASLTSAVRSTSGLDFIRNDGTLDDLTLRALQRFFRETVGNDDGITGTIAREMANVRVGTPMNASAWTGVILASHPEVRSEISIYEDMNVVNSWLARGGIALGANAQLPQVRYPVVVPTGDLQRALPRATNFAREHKAPLAIGAAILLVSGGVLTYRSLSDHS